MKIFQLCFLLVATMAATGVESNENPESFFFTESMTRNIIRLRNTPFAPSKVSKVANVQLNTTVVHTPMGNISGVILKTCRRGVLYGAFYGIPYAKPPIGELRFKAPVPAEPWKGTYDASYERPACMEFEGFSPLQSEDCLYLNVFTPNYNRKYRPRAVMVFIHGGAFIAGSSSSAVYGPDFLIDNGVILVTINYRLGVLGFLSLQNEKVPGNAGLKDQVLALKWVQENIASFGGDPSRVTIFGESAGAASVNFHLLSKKSRGLFHGAIMESGTATASWALTPQNEVIKKAQTLGTTLKCNATNIDMLYECLRSRSAKEITANQQKTLSLADLLSCRPFAFVPTVEPPLKDAFLSEEPYKLISEGKFNRNVSVIIGSNTREGLLFHPVLKKIDPLQLLIQFLGIDVSIFFPYQLKQKMNFWEKREIHSKLYRFYFGKKIPPWITRNAVIDLITDSAFTMPTQHMAALLATHIPVYNYLFSYEGEYGIFKKINRMEDVEGVSHMDELGYLFFTQDLHSCHAKIENSNILEAENITRIMTKMWSNFANTGNPTPNLSSTDYLPQWNSRTYKDLIYLEIGAVPKLRANKNQNLLNRINFWYDVVRDYL